MKNKSILVTGGCGFIGSYIVDELINDNEIIIIDNLSTGKIDNLKSPIHENLHLINEDLFNLDLKDILSNVDYIFHLAAMASVPLSVENPIKCNQENVINTVNLINAAKDNNVKKIVFSSSSAVYGENNNMPLKESEIPMPTSPYATSKACCELYLKSFYESYGLNYTVLRYFNVFGPKQDKNSQYAAVIPNFISAILEGKQPIIFGDGEQTRDFVYVKDIANANISACKSSFNGIVNVASGKKISINELFEIIKKALHSEISPNYCPPRKGDIKHSLACVENMGKINCHINSDNFNEQLEETVNWFKTQL